MNSHDQALYELMSERYDGLKENCDTLRASLHDMEKRHEEKTAALEVARRDRDEANELLRQTTKQLAECINDRDTALAQAAGLRDALTQVSTLAGNWQTQDQIYDIMRAALDTPGPTIGEIKAGADALDEVAVLKARVGELAEERDMWRIRCESPDCAGGVMILCNKCHEEFHEQQLWGSAEEKLREACYRKKQDEMEEVSR